MGQCHRIYTHEIADSSDTEDSDTNDKESAEQFFDELNEWNSIGAMSPEKITRFVLKLYLQKLPDDLKILCMKYLGEDSKIINNLDLQYPFNSTILTTNEKYSLLQVLQKHLRNKSITFKLIFRASQHGYTADSFHKKCNKYDYTLFIIEPLSNTQNTKLPVFGAFTSIKISNIEKEHRDPNMFLFRVRSGFQSKQLVEPNIYHSESSFKYHRKNYVKTYTHSIIGFGNHSDGGQENTYLLIDDKCNWRNSYISNDNITKWMQDTVGFFQNKNKVFFRIKELEVFQIEQLFVARHSSSSLIL